MTSTAEVEVDLVSEPSLIRDRLNSLYFFPWNNASESLYLGLSITGERPALGWSAHRWDDLKKN